MAETNMLDQNGTGNKTEKEEKTVKYKVLHTCYWNETLYHVDDVVELPETAKPPIGDNGHFVKL